MRTTSWIAAVLGIGLLLGCSTASGPTAPKPQAARPSVPAFSCYAHIVNSSACPWTVGAIADHGNVYFGDGTLPNCNQENGPCTIPPGIVDGVVMQYTTTAGFINGTMVINSQSGVGKSFPYNNSQGGNNCPSILHSGNTGGVAVNDPGNGDLNAWSCAW